MIVVKSVMRRSICWLWCVVCCVHYYQMRGYARITVAPWHRPLLSLLTSLPPPSQLPAPSENKSPGHRPQVHRLTTQG